MGVLRRLMCIASAVQAASSSSFGDSAFGAWISDAYGAPAFAYTGSSVASPRSVVPTSPVAFHHAGNDRVEALAWTDGTLSLRQDEGGPKLLNGYDMNTSTYQFRGGFGYLSDQSVLGCSAINGTVGYGGSSSPNNLTLVFGMGYVAKGFTASTPTTSHSTAAPSDAAGTMRTTTVTHTLVAPWGDFPLLFSIVDVGAGAGAGVQGEGGGGGGRDCSAQGGRPCSSSPSAPSPSPSFVWTEVWSSGDRWELGWDTVLTPGYQQAWSHNVSAVVDPASGAVIGLVDTAAIITGQSQPRGSAGGVSGMSATASSGLPTPSAHDPHPRPAFLLCMSCLTPPGAGTPAAAAATASSPSAAVRSYTTAGQQLYCPSGLPCGDSSIDGPVTRGAGMMVAGLDNSTASTGNGTVLALQVPIPSPAAGSTSSRLAFAYGYLTSEQQAAAGGDLPAAVLSALSAWAADYSSIDATTVAAWANYGNDLQFSSSSNGTQADSSAAGIAARALAAHYPAETAAAEGAAAGLTQPSATRFPSAPTGSWEGREASWHSYMLRAGLTFDDYYSNHILNQNGNYLYVSGQQAAARDPLAYVMAFSWAGRGASTYLLEVLNYTLLSKRTAADSMGRPAGSIPWGRSGYGMDGSASFNQSDMELALLFTLAQYALGTRDVASLTNGTMSWNGTTLTILDSAWLSYLHLEGVIGLGQHGLIHLLLSDHNDGLLSTFGIKMRPEIMQTAESVMNTALASYVLPLYAEVLQMVGQGDRATRVLAFAEAARAAINAAWSSNGTVGWYSRVFLGNSSDLGWRGRADVDGQLWTETQSWAILGGAPTATGAPASRLTDLVSTLESIARSPSPIGAINAPPRPMLDGGVGYTGVWYCGETALVSALGLRGFPDTALDEWRKASLANHAEVYPTIWLGITSGPDVYNSVYVDSSTGNYPGSTRCHWNDPGNSSSGIPCEELAFPVLNMWSHTLGTYTLPALVGAEWDAQGLLLRPQISGEEWYSVWTPLVSVTRQAAGSSGSNGGGGGNLGAAAPAPSCSYTGHWSPYLPLGSPVSIRILLLPSDLALCKGLSINGHTVPLVVDPTTQAVVVNGTLASARALAAAGSSSDAAGALHGKQRREEKEAAHGRPGAGHEHHRKRSIYTRDLGGPAPDTGILVWALS